LKEDHIDKKFKKIKSLLENNQEGFFEYKNLTYKQINLNDLRG
jgi:hypothetical protein